jgi:hypothetical protein
MKTDARGGNFVGVGPIDYEWDYGVGVEGVLGWDYKLGRKFGVGPFVGITYGGTENDAMNIEWEPFNVTFGLAASYF